MIYINKDIKDFVKNTESIIKNYKFNKTTEIYFNIEENTNYIWDIIFLGELIKKQLSEESLSKVDKLVKNNLTINKTNITPLYTYENISEYQSLQESLVIVNLLKDYLSNNEIDEPQTNINITILDNNYSIKAKYLKEFSSGIIPLNQDKKISELTDKTVLNLYNKLNLNYKDIIKYEYRTNIDRINFLLELVKYDQEKLTKLPVSLFTSSVPESWIKKLIKLTNNNLDILISLPDTIYIEQPYLDYIKELLTLVDNDYSKLNELPTVVFTRNTNIKRITTIIEHTSKKNISELKNLPNEIFTCSEKRLNFFIMKTKSKLNLLKNLNPYAFSSKTTEERLLLLINLVNEDYKLLSNINPLFYTSSNKRVRFILQTIKSNKEKLSLIPDAWFNEKKSSEDRIKFLYQQFKEKLIIPNELIEILYYDSSSKEDRIKYITNITDNINKIKELPYIVFKDTTKESTINELYEFTNKKIDELKNIPLELYEEKIKINTYRDILMVLTEKERVDYKDYKLVFPFIKNNISDKRFIYQRINHLLKIYKKEEIYELKNEFFSLNTTNSRISFIINITKNNPEKLSLIPLGLYNKDYKVARIMSLYNLVKKDLHKLNELPEELYSCHKKILKVLYKLHQSNQAKPLLGLGDERTLRILIMILTEFSEYTIEKGNANQQLTTMNISYPENILLDNESNITKELNKLSNIIDQQPKKLEKEGQKTIKSKINSYNKKINNALKELDEVIIKQNDVVLQHIKSSITKLRFHIKGRHIIFEDYTLDENSFRQHSFKIEGTIEEFFILTNSLIAQEKNITNKNQTEEIYNRLTSTDKKVYGKRLINTIFNRISKFQENSKDILYVDSKLNQLGATDITFIFEDTNIIVKYKDGRKKYYSELPIILREIKELK